MKVESLTLRRFRNITDCTLEPDPGINFLMGRNGQGKTSFLEALAYLATLRSFRGSKAQEILQWGADSAEVLCRIHPEEPAFSEWDTELKLSFAFTDPGRTRATKAAFINGKPYRSSTQYLSQRFGHFELGFHAVVFNPSDHDLVRGDPATRRAYLDRVIAAEDLDYLKTLQKFQRTLEQRNALLKSSEAPHREMLREFTEPLARYGAELTQRRLAWIQRLAGRLNDLLHQIAPHQPDLHLIYSSNWVPLQDDFSLVNKYLNPLHFSGHASLPSLELLEQAFWKKQAVLEAAEWKTGHSLVGPHRDDWTFLLGSQVLKGHGSQGEVRSALLALKLAEIELFHDSTGHGPIFLLDDFSSELDQERRSFLLKSLAEKDLQVFVTTTEDRSPIGARFRIFEGKASRIPDTAEGSNRKSVDIANESENDQREQSPAKSAQQRG